MGIPTGKIVDRPLLARACGCMCEFQVFERDRFRAQRQAAFVGSRCPDCVLKAQAEEQRIAALLPAKGEAIRALPVDTRVSMTRLSPTSWSGSLTAGGTTVTGTSENPTGLVMTLARTWLAGQPDRTKVEL